MKQLIVGYGEIGKAIKKVLNDYYSDVKAYDPYVTNLEDEVHGQFNIMHVCFPYFDKFVEQVKKYEKEFNPGIIIIHSTVPIGTAKLCGAVSSPCRGIHPNLYEGIKTFVKYFGSDDKDRLEVAAEIFENCGVNCQTVPDSNTTEALKLWDTTIYGWNILLEKEIHNWCESNKVDFNYVYTDANKTYNDGYSKLGKSQYQKYVLNHVPGKLGGHCVAQNCKLLDSFIAKTIEEYNKNLA